MTRYRSPRVVFYAALVGAGAVVSVALGRAEPLLIVAPLLLYLIGVGIAAKLRPTVAAEVAIERLKCVEGDELEFQVRITNGAGRLAVTFLVDANDSLDLIQPPPSVTMRPHSQTTIRGRVRCKRWGVHAFGGGYIRARDQVSAFTYERHIEPRLDIRVYPRPETLRSMVNPKRLRPLLGTWVSRSSGTGLEYADIKEFTSGDQRRHINWKATARRRQLHVNLFHPERSSDAVILLDTYADVRGTGASSLDLAVRAAISIAAESVAIRDRVGFLAVGGNVEWLLSGTGFRQLYRIVDALMTTQIIYSYAWPNAKSIPRHVIPPGALVICLTSFADRRMSHVVQDMRTRGHDVVVVELPAQALLPPPSTEREALARKLWSMQCEVDRNRYRGNGIPITVWDPGRPLEIAINELQSFRRASMRMNSGLRRWA